MSEVLFDTPFIYPDLNQSMKKLFLIFVCLCIILQYSEACTSIIISGKATPDGRPLMWKHRDTDEPYNHIVYVDEGGYRFLGLANSSNKQDDAIWTGSNETGFSIMNTASFNLKDDDIEEMDQEGALMRKALKTCKTISDFEHLLDTLPRPLRVEANFGVIDAFGGAAYYETNNERYYKKDVNDPVLAPDGYIIYTNFSFEGRKDEGLGYIRYESARKIFKEMEKEGFTPWNIFREASCSFYNSLLDIDLKNENESPNRHSGWFIEQDFIPRSESTASIVIQGVKPGMNAELTTIWTALGYPPTSAVLPLWVKMGTVQPALTSYDSVCGTAPLCLYASKLKENIYSIHRGNGRKYLHWQLLWNNEKTGYMQKLASINDETFDVFTSKQAEWEKNGLDTSTIKELYRNAEIKIRGAYRQLSLETK